MLLITSRLWDGRGQHPALHISDVHVILGNGLARSKVWADEENAQNFQNVFIACAVTHAMSNIKLDIKQSSTEASVHFCVCTCTFVHLSWQSSSRAKG